MFIKSSILACFFAGIAIAHAVPLERNIHSTIEKRGKKHTLQLVPTEVPLTPTDQVMLCILNEVLHPPKDDDEQLSYQALVQGCSDAVNKAMGQLTISPTDAPGPVLGPKGQQGIDGTDTGAAGTDTGAAGTDTVAAGTDTGAAGTDTGAAGTDTGAAGTDTGAAGTDTGAASG